GEVLLWDPDAVFDLAREPKPTRLNAGAPIRCLAFGPTALAAGTTAGTVVLWSVESVERVAHLGTVTVPFEGNVAEGRREIRCLAFNADGTRLATGGWDGKVRLWDAADPRNVRPLEKATFKAPSTAPRQSVNTVAFQPKGGALAMGGTARAVGA